LDEPTNHLDVEVISWLARHLAARSGAMLIVTHDRWFLDEVCTNTWEVSDGTIHQYEGGYAAYVLARAERDRQASSREDKRRQLVRKELAWLRRGPPARTAKPKFRIEAANTLIADEPPARDTTELLRFANSRLGNKVINAEDVSYAYDDQRVINEITWRLGPGERLALVGANGSGKSTLMSLLAQELTPTTGWVDRGETVKLAYLSQSAAEIPEHLNVLAAVEEIRKRSTLADGSELTAGKLAERFGFRGEKTRTLVRDLSGGERRRLVLMRLLMSEPNVLLLDEPTNDLDIDTLTALEDLLDQWPGTLVVISHDRYFIERVCDNVFALTQNGGIRHLPGGVDQYIADLDRSSSAGAPAGQRGPATRKAGKDAREARKEAQRLERELERQTAREQELHELMATSSSDHARLSELTVELQTVNAERERLETAWLEAAETLEA
jgi:ATP-binding cassette subfamily F protein uup